MAVAGQKTIRFAARAHSIQESPTMAVMNRAAALIASGVDVIDFGPGEPDFNTPANVAEAGKRAIDDGFTKYTNAGGTKALRQAIADRYNARYATKLGVENVIAGSGGKQELFNLMLALIEEGDEVIIPVPYWVSFPDQVSFAGGTPVFAQTDVDNGYRPRFSDIEAAATDRTRAVIINSPANPSGAVIDREELERIVAWCVGRGIFLIFDETYELFVYRGEHSSAMTWFERHPEQIIVVNSMSKTFAMTGWRLGYAVAHKEIISVLAKIQSHSTSNPCTIAQAAALEGLTGDKAEVQRMFDAYSERRAWIVPALNAIDGVCCADPDGAFYVVPDFSELVGKGSIRNSTSFADYLLDVARVAVVPGAAFGMDRCVRISYAASMDRIREGVGRMAAAIKAL